VEGFAKIRALLDAGEPRARVLAAHGLDDARWREEEEQVLSDLADAAEQADLHTLRLYQEAYQATWRRVVGEAPVEPDLTPSTSAPGPATIVGERVVRGQTPAEDQLTGSETREVDVGALRTALPFVQSGAPATESVVSNSPITAEPTPGHDRFGTQSNECELGGTGTTDVDVSALRAALPFTPNEGMDAEQPGLGAKSDELGGDSTAEIDVSALRAALPFMKGTT
jgi:hypothetical protein